MTLACSQAERMHRQGYGMLLVMTCLLSGTGCRSTAISDASQPPSKVAIATSEQAASEQAASEKATAEESASEESASEVSATYPVAPFEEEVLYQLLVAEVAGHRHNYQQALQHYVAVTRATRDPGVAARATSLALYMQELDAALETAMIWAATDPAHFDILHFERLVRHSSTPSQKQSLLEGLSRVLAQKPEAPDLLFFKAALLTQTGAYEESLALAGQLLEASDQRRLFVLQVSNLKHLGRQEDARSLLETTLQARPEDSWLLLTLARLLHEEGELDAAREQYLLALEGAGNDGDILLALALLAIEEAQDEDAKRHLQRLLRWEHRQEEAHYYLGVIAERQSDSATALAAYKQVRQSRVFPLAQARIASLLAADNQLPGARAHLAQVAREHPELYIRMTILEAQLLAAQALEQQLLVAPTLEKPTLKQPVPEPQALEPQALEPQALEQQTLEQQALEQEALEQEALEQEVFQLLDRALEKTAGQVPQQVELLYIRAMLEQRFGHLDIFETNLRQLLALEPAHAEALNALGYTLTDQTERHAEALLLIEQALALKPEEAAFIDSLGWVQYRLQNYDVAVQHLRQAYALFPNDEIAAHLGEVLWTIGAQTEAKAIWDKALEMSPESEILRAVIQRFLAP